MDSWKEVVRGPQNDLKTHILAFIEKNKINLKKFTHVEKAYHELCKLHNTRKEEVNNVFEILLDNGANPDVPIPDNPVVGASLKMTAFFLYNNDAKGLKIFLKFGAEITFYNDMSLLDYKTCYPLQQDKDTCDIVFCSLLYGVNPFIRHKDLTFSPCEHFKIYGHHSFAAIVKIPVKTVLAFIDCACDLDHDTTKHTLQDSLWERIRDNLFQMNL